MLICEGFAFFCNSTGVCLREVCLLLLSVKLHSLKTIFRVFIYCGFSFSVDSPILFLVLAKINPCEIIITICEYLYLNKLIYAKLISNRLIFAKIVSLR